jgi:putative intracellular protease/amidase
LIYSNQFDKAAALISSIDPGIPTGPRVLRLQSRLLAEQRKFTEAAGVEATICSGRSASASDWNDLAWTDLFAETGALQQMKAAAEKAVELTESSNLAVLHTSAVVQATAGDLKDARAAGYRLLAAEGVSDDVLTTFGRIAEEIGLPSAAREYYARVAKPENNSALSAFAYAQRRLRELAAHRATE